jgi:hypothetical protein
VGQSLDADCLTHLYETLDLSQNQNFSVRWFRGLSQ